MFEVGTILYLNPFYFKNGNTAKNKYLIILKKVDEKVIIASLPTRTNKAPSLVIFTHGCNNDADRNFNCYALQAHFEICNNGFSFPIQTFIYGNEVEDYAMDALKFNHKIEGVDFEICGQLNAKEYTEIINCLKQSRSIRRGIKKLL